MVWADLTTHLYAQSCIYLEAPASSIQPNCCHSHFHWSASAVGASHPFIFLGGDNTGSAEPEEDASEKLLLQPEEPAFQPEQHLFTSEQPLDDADQPAAHTDTIHNHHGPITQDPGAWSDPFFKPDAGVHGAEHEAAAATDNTNRLPPHSSDFAQGERDAVSPDMASEHVTADPAAYGFDERSALQTTELHTDAQLYGLQHPYRHSDESAPTLPHSDLPDGAAAVAPEDEARAAASGQVVPVTAGAESSPEGGGTDAAAMSPAAAEPAGDAASAVGPSQSAEVAVRGRPWWQRGWGSPATADDDAAGSAGSPRRGGSPAVGAPGAVPVEPDSTGVPPVALAHMGEESAEPPAGPREGAAPGFYHDPVFENGDSTLPPYLAVAALPDAAAGADAVPGDGMNVQHAYDAGVLGWQGAGVPDADPQPYGVPHGGGDVAGRAEQFVDSQLPSWPEGAAMGGMQPAVLAEGTLAGGPVLHTRLPQVDAPAAEVAVAATFGQSHVNGMHEPALMLPSVEEAAAPIGSSPARLNDSAMCGACTLMLPALPCQLRSQTSKPTLGYCIA